MSEEGFTVTRVDEPTGEKITLAGILWAHPTNKDTIIVCHGMFGRKESGMGPLLSAALCLNWSVARFDFAGNGSSTGEWSYADYPREVRDIAAVVKYLEEEAGRSVVGIIGHSKAGADVLIAAATPGVAPNPRCCFVSIAGRLTFGKPEKRFSPEELAEAKEKGFFMWKFHGKEWKITQSALDERRTMDPRVTVRAISPERACRVLQVHGTADDSTPPAEAEVVRAIIPGAEVKYIEGTNHFFTSKEVELSNTVRDWLKAKLL